MTTDGVVEIFQVSLARREMEEIKILLEQALNRADALGSARHSSRSFWTVEAWKMALKRIDDRLALFD